LTLFKEVEYLERIEKTKKSMSEAAIDVLVVSDPANMNYLTGYDGWSFYVPQCVVLALDEEQPLWIGRGMDAAGARHTTFLDEKNIIGYPDHYVQSLERHPLNFVGDRIRERGWGTRTIGVEMDAYYFTARSYAELRKSLGDARFVNGDLLVNWIRLIKSEAEIAFMREAGVIAGLVMSTAIDSLRPGVRECDAVAAVYQAQMSGTPEFGGDYPAIVPMMPTGEKTSAPHLTWTDEPYKNEQMVNLELAACRHRYHCPIARTAYLGKNPPEKLVELAGHTVEGLNLTLAGIDGLTKEAQEEMRNFWINAIVPAGEWITERNQADMEKMKQAKPSLTFKVLDEATIADLKKRAETVYPLYSEIGGEGADKILNAMLTDIEGAKKALNIQ
jgi:Xaa-Pro dipeptidase